MNLRQIGRGVLWFAIGAAVVAVPVLLMRHQARPITVVDPHAIRSYRVAPEIADELKSALEEVLNSPISRVSIPADGLLSVNAPESTQADVKALLAEVATKKPAATPSIRIETWLVSAEPGAAAKSEGPGLVEVHPALAELQKAQGPLHFNLVEKLALQVRAGGDKSQIQGAHAVLQVTPTLRHDSKGDPMIAARIDVQIISRTPPQFPPLYTTPGSLKALVELRPGQLLVIGQSSLTDRAVADSTPAQMYYIVRASL